MIINKIRLNKELQLSSNGTITIKQLDYTPEFVKYKTIRGKDIKENDELFITSKQLFFPLGLPNFKINADGVDIQIIGREFTDIDDLVSEINKFSVSLFDKSIAIKQNNYSFSLKPAVSFILIPDDSYLINIFDEHFVINKIPFHLLDKEFIMFEFGIPFIEENLLYNYISEYDREWIKSDPGFSIFFDALAIEFERIYKFAIDISDTLDKQKIIKISEVIGLPLNRIDVLNETNITSLFKQLIQFISKKGTYFSLYRMLNSLGFVVEKIEELDVNSVPFTNNLVNGIVIDFYKQYLEPSEFRTGFVWYGDEYLDPVLAKKVPGRIIKSGNNYYKSDGKNWLQISKSDVFISNPKLEKEFFMINRIDNHKISVEEFNSLVDDYTIVINNISNISEFPIDSEKIRYNSFIKIHNIEPFFFSNDKFLSIEIDSVKYEIDFSPLLRSKQRNYLYTNEIFLYLLENNVPCTIDKNNNIILYSNFYNKKNTIKIIQKPDSLTFSNIFVPDENGIFLSVDSSFYNLTDFEPNSIIKFYKNGLVTSNKPFDGSVLYNGIYVSRIPGENEKSVLDIEKLDNNVFRIIKRYDKKADYRYPYLDELDQNQYLYILAFYRNKKNSAYHEEPTNQNSFYSRSGDKLREEEAGLSSEVKATISKTNLIKTLDQNFVNQIFYSIEFIRSALISLLSLVIVLERFYDKLEKITERFDFYISFKDVINSLWRRSTDPKYNIPNIPYDNYDINMFLINFFRLKRKDANIPIFDRILKDRELYFDLKKEDYEIDINLIKNILHIPTSPSDAYKTSEKMIMHIENNFLLKSIYEKGFSNFLFEFHEYSSDNDYNQKVLLYDDENPKYFDEFNLNQREIIFNPNSKKSIKNYFNSYSGFFRKHIHAKDSAELTIKAIPDINNGQENYFLISDYPLTKNSYLKLDPNNHTILPEGFESFFFESLNTYVPYLWILDILFINNKYILSVYNPFNNFGTILVSDNLTSWAPVTSNLDMNHKKPFAMANNENNVVVCVGQGYVTGFIMRSTNNGLDWSFVVTDTIYLFDVTYGNNTFIALGVYGAGDVYVLRSNDGLQWNTVFILPAIAFSSLITCTFGNGIFVFAFLDSSLNTKIYTSSDNGLTWQLTFDSANYNIQLTPYQVNYTDNKFILTCNNRRIVKSTDGINWTIEEIPLISPPSSAYGGVAYGNGFISIISATVANNQNTNRLIFSNDGGITWNYKDLPGAYQIRKMKFINNYFFGVAGLSLGNNFIRFNITEAPTSIFNFISP